MRKIPPCLENPVDNIIISLSCYMGPVFKKMNFTPNGITTLSLITGLLSVYFLYKSKPILAVVLYFISYIFDCLDGWYAREYNMCTKFGDKYDHFKDWTVTTLYCVVLYQRNKHKLTTGGWLIVLFIYLFLIFCNLLIGIFKYINLKK